MTAVPMPIVSHTFQAAVITTHDGDTFTARLRLTPWNIEQVGRIRLAGLNAPELVTPAGKVAAQFTADWLTVAGTTLWPLVVVAAGVDNYGRVLGSVWRTSDGAQLNADLLASGNAVVMALAAQLAKE